MRQQFAFGHQDAVDGDGIRLSVLYCHVAQRRTEGLWSLGDPLERAHLPPPGGLSRPKEASQRREGVGQR
jgi:hypothetical protein